MCLHKGIGQSCGPTRLRASNIIIIILTKLVLFLFVSLFCDTNLYMWEVLIQSSGQSSSDGCQMGPLHDPVTWYKIIYTGEQVAQWDFQNNATRTSSPGPVFVLEVPLRNLLTSIYNFVPCDRIVQRAHCVMFAHGQRVYVNTRQIPI